jgi:hypothetical protein
VVRTTCSLDDLLPAYLEAAFATKCPADRPQDLQGAEAGLRIEIEADFNALAASGVPFWEPPDEESQSDLSELTESEDERRRKRARDYGAKGLDSWR